MTTDLHKELQRIMLNLHQERVTSVQLVEEDSRTEMEWTNTLKMFIIPATIHAKVVVKCSPPRTKSVRTTPETANRKQPDQCY